MNVYPQNEWYNILYYFVLPSASGQALKFNYSYLVQYIVCKMVTQTFVMCASNSQAL